MRSLLLALQFLTIFFFFKDLSPRSASEMAWSQAFFPLVGGLLGGILAATAWGASNLFPSSISAVLVLILHFLLTRGLHVDGLADSADGLMGGSNRERVLKIMKDSRTGAMGVSSVVLIFLIKFAALEVIISQKIFWGIVAGPIIARVAPGVFSAILPYARSQGLAQEMVSQGRWSIALVALSLGAGTLFLFLPLQKLLLLSVATLLLWGLLIYYYWLRLGGVTGDLFGATIELTESLVWTIICCNLTR